MIRISAVLDDTGAPTNAVSVSGLSLFDRALLEVGSERSAIAHAARMYKVERPMARILVRAARANPIAADDRGRSP